MRDQTPNNISEPNSNIIVNLHPTEGTHWVLVIRREGGPVYYFDSFGIETPPLFLREYVNLGSNERIQQYDESYCGAYCLYMIYLIDRGFRINNAVNILVNQCKYPGMYNECFCLGCNDKVNDNDNQGTDSVRGMPTCFTDDKVNDNDKINDNDKVNDNDNVKFNVMIMIMLMLMIMIMSMFMIMIMMRLSIREVVIIKGVVIIREVVLICKAGSLISEAVQQSCFANSPICKAGSLIRWIYHPREIIILLPLI